jgi:hypothetical protein
MANTANFNPSANNIAFADSTVALLDALSVKRDAWEQGVFKAANEALYALLAETLEIYNSKFLQGGKDDQRTLRQQLVSRLNEMGIKTQKNSTALGMLVRFVFKSDRKRAHRYAYVLSAAVQENVSSANFAGFVRDAGGVEEIVRKMVVKEDTRKKREAVQAAQVVTKDELEYNTLNPLAVVNLDIEGDYAVLIAKPQPDGTTRIVSVLPSATESVINALMQHIAKHKVATATADAQNAEEIDSFKQPTRKADPLADALAA